MKVQLNTQKRKEELATLSKETREAVIDSNIEVFGVMWQVAAKDRDNIKSALDTAIILAEQAPSSVGWILADNSERDTTVAELQQVLVAHAMRRLAVFEAYKTWRKGAANTPFTYNG